MRKTRDGRSLKLKYEKESELLNVTEAAPSAETEPGTPMTGVGQRRTGKISK